MREREKKAQISKIHRRPCLWFGELDICGPHIFLISNIPEIWVVNKLGQKKINHMRTGLDKNGTVGKGRRTRSRAGCRPAPVGSQRLLDRSLEGEVASDGQNGIRPSVPGKLLYRPLANLPWKWNPVCRRKRKVQILLICRDRHLNS